MKNLDNLLNLFKSKNLIHHNLAIGLDIGSFSVKAVALSFKEKVPLFEEFAVESIGQDTTYEKIVETIKFVCSRLKNSSKKVNIGIKPLDTIIRHITFPRMSDAELRGALSFEISKYIPYNVNEIIYDSCILSQLPNNKMNVLLVAVKKDTVDNFIKMVQQAGLEPALLDVDALAVANAFTLLDSKDTAALINIGAKSSTLNIFKDNILSFTRDIEIAGNQFTNTIKDQLQLNLKDAEDIKCNPKNRLEELRRLIVPLVNDLAVEVRSSFDYFEDQGGSKVSRVYISGGSVLFEGIDKLLSKALELNVECWNPLGNLSTKPGISSEKLCSIAAQLAVATGLALRGQA